ncbi:MAG: hypothetical protein RMM51_08240 [Verrucomicrobiae bacterium]|nr:hypothetical protein [Verrucomicrobiae bacterium]
MTDIHINYDALTTQPNNKVQVSSELVRKAKGLLGFSARKELVQRLDPQLRLLAVEVAQRQVNPMQLYDAGVNAILEALKLYDPEKTTQPFPQFAQPFIRTAMIHARDKLVS